MTSQELAEHNQLIRKELSEMQQRHYLEECELKSKIINPCGQCPNDGVYRCEACQEDNFIGFNRKELPWDIHDDHHESDSEDESDFDSK